MSAVFTDAADNKPQLPATAPLIAFIIDRIMYGIHYTCIQPTYIQIAYV